MRFRILVNCLIISEAKYLGFQICELIFKSTLQQYQDGPALPILQDQLIGNSHLSNVWCCGGHGCSLFALSLPSVQRRGGCLRQWFEATCDLHHSMPSPSAGLEFYNLRSSQIRCFIHTYEPLIKTFRRPVLPFYMWPIYSNVFRNYLSMITHHSLLEDTPACSTFQKFEHKFRQFGLPLHPT